MVLRTYMRLSLTLSCFFFNDTATTEIYTLSLHDALPIWGGEGVECGVVRGMHGHQLTLQMRGQLGHLEPALRQRSEEHTSELQSLRHLVCRLLLEKKKKEKNQRQKQTLERSIARNNHTNR